MGSTEPQHTPNKPAVPLKPFGRPCKIFVTTPGAVYVLSPSQLSSLKIPGIALKRHYGGR
jgi:hypothetical protein